MDAYDELRLAANEGGRPGHTEPHDTKHSTVGACLVGSCKDGQVSVAAIKDQSWWQEATGSKAVAMAQEAPRLCGTDSALKDVAALKAFTASEKWITSPPWRRSRLAGWWIQRALLPNVSWELLQSTSTN